MESWGKERRKIFRKNLENNFKFLGNLGWGHKNALGWKERGSHLYRMRFWMGKSLISYSELVFKTIRIWWERRRRKTLLFRTATYWSKRNIRTRWLGNQWLRGYFSLLYWSGESKLCGICFDDILRSLLMISINSITLIFSLLSFDFAIILRHI